MKKFICILISAVLLLSVAAPAFAATKTPNVIQPRIPTLVIAETTTDVWRNKPREAVNNDRIAIAPAGSVFSYIRTYVDPSGEYWYFVTIISMDAPGADNVLGAQGYVSANDTRLEIRG